MTHDKTLRELQTDLPWTIKYAMDFRSNTQAHKDFAHALVHVAKALGKLSGLVDDMDHNRDVAADPTLGQRYAKYIADLVVCALRAANTFPGGVIDLQKEVQNRIASKNAPPAALAPTLIPPGQVLRCTALWPYSPDVQCSFAKDHDGPCWWRDIPPMPAIKTDEVACGTQGTSILLNCTFNRGHVGPCSYAYEAVCGVPSPYTPDGDCTRSVEHDGEHSWYVSPPTCGHTRISETQWGVSNICTKGKGHTGEHGNLGHSWSTEEVLCTSSKNMTDQIYHCVLPKGHAGKHGNSKTNWP